jgi:hypothetical protein
MDALPPSLDALMEAIERGEVTPPEHRTLPWWYPGRGRGVLLAVALLGLLAFFAPWVVMAQPEIAAYSGFELARGRAGWLWGGAVGWFVMIPLVVTRRTIARMRGVRIITATFAAMTLAEVLMLLSLPPRGSQHVSVEFSWGWGLYASGIASLLGIFFGARFGGRLDRIEALPWRNGEGDFQIESSGQPLH